MTCRYYDRLLAPYILSPLENPRKEANNYGRISEQKRFSQRQGSLYRGGCSQRELIPPLFFSSCLIQAFLAARNTQDAPGQKFCLSLMSLSLPQFNDLTRLSSLLMALVFSFASRTNSLFLRFRNLPMWKEETGINRQTTGSLF